MGNREKIEKLKSKSSKLRRFFKILVVHCTVRYVPSTALPFQYFQIRVLIGFYYSRVLLGFYLGKVGKG
jgi:hypothetical protein